MTDQTLFLQPVGELPTVEPIFVQTTGEVVFSDFSLEFLDTSASAITDSSVIAGLLVAGGTVIAEADATAVSQQNPAFSNLVTQALGVGDAAGFQASALGEAAVVSSFNVEAYQEFSFDFNVLVSLGSTEILDRSEFTVANSRTSFAILGLRGTDDPILLDVFSLDGTLVSSEGVATLNPIATSDNISLTGQSQSSDIGFENGVDFIEGQIAGTYSREFNHDVQITVVEINTSAVELSRDLLLNNLGKDVRYGTLLDDRVWGTKRNDKIYGSFGDDKLYGLRGHDILEGGWGHDILKGGSGRDKLHGSLGEDSLYGDQGNDILVGGAGNDLIVGGRGHDRLTGAEGSDIFQFESRRKYRAKDLGTDRITDFEIGTDKIALKLRTFHELSGNVGDSLQASEFATVTTKFDAFNSSALIVYNSSTGDLFYNQNGPQRGLGKGGRFASVEGGMVVAGLDASDFMLI